jgi:hypothetical protein
VAGGDDAEDRDADPRGDHVEAGPQERHVAAKLVDQQAAHARALVRFEQVQRPQQGGEDPAAIDGADEQDRRVGEGRDRMLTMSPALRLISAGLPAPSMMTTSCAARSVSRLAAIVSSRAARWV